MIWYVAWYTVGAVHHSIHRKKKKKHWTVQNQTKPNQSKLILSTRKMVLMHRTINRMSDGFFFMLPRFFFIAVPYNYVTCDAVLQNFSFQLKFICRHRIRIEKQRPKTQTVEMSNVYSFRIISVSLLPNGATNETVLFSLSSEE